MGQGRDTCPYHDYNEVLLASSVVILRSCLTLQHKGFKQLCSQSDIDQVATLHDSQLHATNMKVVLSTDGPSSHPLSPPLVSPAASPPPSSSPTHSPLPIHPQQVSPYSALI